MMLVVMAENLAGMIFDREAVPVMRERRRGRVAADSTGYDNAGNGRRLRQGKPGVVVAIEKRRPGIFGPDHRRNPLDAGRQRQAEQAAKIGDQRGRVV